MKCKLWLWTTVLAMAVAPAAAQERLPDVIVQYGDLNLSTVAGVKTLDWRLRNAVNATCESDDGVHEMAWLVEIEKCRAKQWAAITPLRAAVLGRFAHTK